MTIVHNSEITLFLFRASLNYELLRRDGRCWVKRISNKKGFEQRWFLCREGKFLVEVAFVGRKLIEKVGFEIVLRESFLCMARLLSRKHLG